MRGKLIVITGVMALGLFACGAQGSDPGGESRSSEVIGSAEAAVTEESTSETGESMEATVSTETVSDTTASTTGPSYEDEDAWLATYNLLTAKPVIYAANVAEDDIADDGENNSHVQAVREYAAGQNSEVFVICAQIEEEISELDDDEKAMFLDDLGLKESGLEKLIKASYHIIITIIIIYSNNLQFCFYFCYPWDTKA